jgi:hypothetical protein
MHIATTTLVACMAFAVGPWLGAIATVCTVLMMVASVSLGWHYALDGYVGALLAIAVWWIAGRLEREVPETTAATVSDIPRLTEWIPASRRRAPDRLPEGVVAVRSPEETTRWATKVARRRRTMRAS